MQSTECAEVEFVVSMLSVKCTHIVKDLSFCRGCDLDDIELVAKMPNLIVLSLR